MGGRIRGSRIRRVLALALAAWGLCAGPATAQELAQERDYRIGVDDVLSISIWESRDLDQVVTVRPDGKISLQLLGDVRADGLSVSELRAELARQYGAIMDDAQVAVNVQEIRSRTVYFVGEIAKPGPLALTRRMTLLQAVAMAGGFTEGADRETAFVLREEQVIPVDFRALMRNPDPAKNVEVVSGDVVVVPAGESVYIQGEVRSPGLLRFDSDLTVLKAIAEAGGLSELARGSRVYLLRGGGESKSRIEVDVDAMISDPERYPDLALEPDDILTVPQRLF